MRIIDERGAEPSGNSGRLLSTSHGQRCGLATEAIIEHPDTKRPLVLIKETAQREFLEGKPRKSLSYTPEQHGTCSHVGPCPRWTRNRAQGCAHHYLDQPPAGHHYSARCGRAARLARIRKRIRQIKATLIEALSEPTRTPPSSQRRYPQPKTPSAPEGPSNSL